VLDNHTKHIAFDIGLPIGNAYVNKPVENITLYETVLDMHCALLVSIIGVYYWCLLLVSIIG
jgi:hypothetical protein